MALFKKKTETNQPPVSKQQPGERIASVMERMYKLIVSVDLNMNSCFIEAGELSIGENTVEPKGYYDKFIATLTECIDEEDRARFAKCFDRQKLYNTMTSGHSCISEIFSIEGTTYEIRCERIPEKEAGSQRVRCCIFIREVESASDDGRPATIVTDDADKKPTEVDRLLRNIYSGAYEINVERGTITGYVFEGNKLRMLDNKQKLEDVINNYIKIGVIAPESAEQYKKLCSRTYLPKKTASGMFSFYAKLKVPGGSDYIWFEENIIAVGGPRFRVFRKNVNEFKNGQDSQVQMEEQYKLVNYSYDMLKAIASLVEFRSMETGTHIEHVEELTMILLSDICERMPEYQLTKDEVNRISIAAVLHDIGKITIPDQILNKPGSLTREEFEVLKEHTVDGAKIINRVKTPEMKELYDVCYDIALHHHERYDGTGYPDGLKADQLSIGAQAVGLADVYDALVSKRCYKEAYEHDRAYNMIMSGECGQFNPKLMESFKAKKDEFRKVYSED